MLPLTRRDSFFAPRHARKLKMFLSQHDEGQISQNQFESSFLSVTKAERGPLHAKNAPILSSLPVLSTWSRGVSMSFIKIQPCIQQAGRHF